MEMLIARNWIKSSLVEVGRVLLLSKGPYSGNLATIVEIIDHKRVWSPLPVHNIYPITSNTFRRNSDRLRNFNRSSSTPPPSPASLTP